MITWLRSHWPDYLLAAGGITLALALRFTLLDFKSVDYFNYTKQWYTILKAQGFSAFGQGFSNYNLPYLYLLYAVIRAFPSLPAVIAIKVPSMVADFVTALLTVRICMLRHKDLSIPMLGGFAVLLAPTVVLNSAFWGQADGIYAACVLACMYFVLRDKDLAAMACFGIAISFKAQALFLAPLLAGLVLRRQIRWRAALMIPVIFLVSLLPAVAAGRSLLEMVLIYPAQAGQYQQLTLHAPSALAWIPDTGRYFSYFDSSGLILAAAASLAYAWVIYRTRATLTPPLLVELALISVMMLPFLLPRMHERYFFMADVLSVVTAFMVPSLFYVPVLMVAISFSAYQPTLFATEPVSMGLLALGVFGLLLALCVHACPQLYRGSSHATGSAAKVESGP